MDYFFCPAAKRPGFSYERLLPGDASSHVVDSLEEDKEYIISIYAVYPQGPSEPVSAVGKTCKLICRSTNEGEAVTFSLTFTSQT